MSKSLCLLVTLFWRHQSPPKFSNAPAENGKTIYQNFRCELDSIGSEATATDREDQTPAVQPSAPVPVRPRSRRRVANSGSSTGVPKEPASG
jgi:hypothetical protein